MKKVILTSFSIAVLAIGVTAQTGTGLSFKFGYKSKIKTTNKSSLGFSGTLTKSYSLKSHTPYVKNQGNYGTCVSWAMAYSALTTQYAIQMNISNRNIITSMAFCPYFLHNNSKVVTDGCASGNFFDDAGAEIVDIGVKKFYLPLIGCATPNDERMLAAAKNYRALDVTNLWVYNDETSVDYATWFDKFMKKTPFNVDDVKRALSSNKVVAFGMCLPKSWFAAYHTSLWEPSYAEKNDPYGGLMSTTGETHGRHAMTIVGYDDSKYGGAFEVMNSWGSEWGDNGYVWVKYADLQKYVFQLVVIDMPVLKLTGTTGCIYGDCDNGYGIYKHENGDMYEGFFNGGKYHGYGIYAWTSGATYAGEWKSGSREGDALVFFSDGSSGPVKYVADEFRSGYQKYSFDNGDTYEGTVKDGELDGFGTYRFANGTNYIGGFSKTNFNGLGKYVSSNGDTYIGFFTDGQRNGKGLFISATGKVWGGNWSYDNFITGKSYGFSAGKEFDFGKLDISSNLSYVDANCISGDCLSGFGTRVYDGRVYEGSFKDGVENGMGKVTYSDGAVMETFYMEGTPYSIAVIKYSDGGTLVGGLKDGRIDGYIVYFDASGGIIIGTYKDGDFVGKLAAANVTDFSKNPMSSPAPGAFKSLTTYKPGVK